MVSELRRKMEVGIAYLELVEEKGEHNVSVTAVAKRARVGWVFAKAIINEYKDNNFLEELSVKMGAGIKAHSMGFHLHVYKALRDC
jgi:hypothetical protein